VFLPIAAVRALFARGGIGGHDAVARSPIFDGGMDFADDSGEFVAENRRRNDHPGVIPPLEDLQIRAASQGGLDAYAHLSPFQRRRNDFFHPDLFLPVKHGRSHSLPGYIHQLANRARESSTPVRASSVPTQLAVVSSCAGALFFAGDKPRQSPATPRSTPRAASAGEFVRLTLAHSAPQASPR